MDNASFGEWTSKRRIRVRVSLHSAAFEVLKKELLENGTHCCGNLLLAMAQSGFMLRGSVKTFTTEKRTKNDGAFSLRVCVTAPTLGRFLGQSKEPSWGNVLLTLAEREVYCAALTNKSSDSELIALEGLESTPQNKSAEGRLVSQPNVGATISNHQALREEPSAKNNVAQAKRPRRANLTIED